MTAIVSSDQPSAAVTPAELLANLVQATSDNLTKLKDADTWSELRTKVYNRLKLPHPSLFSAANPSVLSNPELYILVLAEEKTIALTSIQSYLRCTYPAKRFLVEEMCQMLLSISLILVLADKAKIAPKLIFDALQPLQTVMIGKFIYLSGQAAGLSQNDIAIVNASSITGSADHTVGSHINKLKTRRSHKEWNSNRPRLGTKMNRNEDEHMDKRRGPRNEGRKQ